MPTPIIELIADELVTRLGNTTNVVEVVRPKKREPYTPKNWQIVVIQETAEDLPDLNHPGNPPATAWMQTFKCCLHVVPSESDTTAVDQLINTFVSDAIVAISTSGDSNPWHTFGGYAIDAVVNPPEPINDEDSEGAILNVDVTYRTSENDPYTLRN